MCAITMRLPYRLSRAGPSARVNLGRPPILHSHESVLDKVLWAGPPTKLRPVTACIAVVVIASSTATEPNLLLGHSTKAESARKS